MTPLYYTHHTLLLLDTLLLLNRLATQASGFCWNDNYTPPTVPEGVPDLFTLILDQSVLTCPTMPGEILQLQQALQLLSQHWAAASGGLVQEVIWAPYIPILCEPVSAANTTLFSRGFEECRICGSTAACRTV